FKPFLEVELQHCSLNCCGEKVKGLLDLKSMKRQNPKYKAGHQETQKVKLQALPDLKQTLAQRWVQAKYAQVVTSELQDVQPLVLAQALKWTSFKLNDNGTIL
ncbi:hypothetical protein L0F63_004054, partial [Massospora cicadina]